jgi:hypothetical protein
MNVKTGVIRCYTFATELNEGQVILDTQWTILTASGGSSSYVSITESSADADAYSLKQK